MKARKILKVYKPKQTSDGAGVKLLRAIGSPELNHFDPFLLLDEFRSDQADDYIGGFPSHPHRGFETVTYMIKGVMHHEDSTGESGDLVPGAVQWMTAGRGVVHSEMPKQKEGLIWGFQLWVNLPAKEKMCEPRYQNIPPEKVPVVERGDCTFIKRQVAATKRSYRSEEQTKNSSQLCISRSKRKNQTATKKEKLLQCNSIKVIAGEVDGVKGAVRGITIDPLYIDVTLPPNGSFAETIPERHNSFAYVMEGEILFGNVEVTPSQLVTFGEGSEVTARAGKKGGRFLLLAGAPLNEPIARYGPFVMNTEEEIKQTILDYQSGKF